MKAVSFQRICLVLLVVLIQCAYDSVCTVRAWNTAAAISRRRALIFSISHAAFISTTCTAVGALEEQEGQPRQPQSQEEREAILQRMRERRQLMQAGRSTSSRQEILDLSRQRATLYNTTFQGVTCPPGIPCL